MSAVAVMRAPAPRTIARQIVTIENRIRRREELAAEFKRMARWYAALVEEYRQALAWRSPLLGYPDTRRRERREIERQLAVALRRILSFQYRAYDFERKNSESRAELVTLRSIPRLG